MLRYLGSIKVINLLICFIISVIVAFLFYYAIQPEDLPQLSKSQFKRLKKQHRSRTLTENSLQKLLDTNREYFKETLMRPLLIERVSGTNGNRLAREHIKSVMSDLGWSISEDTFTDQTPIGEKVFTNVIAVQDKYAPRKLTLACHYDSKYYENIVFIGATDSAVPCAMLLDIATVLNQTLWDPQKPSTQISLQYIFFDGEEAFRTWTDTDSIYGARHLAEIMQNERKQVLREVIVSELETMDLFVLLDLIGAQNPVFSNWFESTSRSFKDMRNIELQLSRRGELSFGVRDSNTYFPSEFVRGGGGIQDDHIPFLRNNVPILHLIAYPFPQVWHTENDNERALDYNTIDDLIKIMRVFVAQYLHLNP